MDNIFSSKQVANILGVNESSIKRWTNNGELKCFKTPGGHRKFKKDDIKSFAKRYSIKIENTLFDSRITDEKSNFIDYDKVNELLLRKLFNHSEEEIFDFIYSLLNNGIEPIELFDDVISKVMTKIGMMWERNEIGVEVEHIASCKLINVLIRIEKELKNSSNGNKVICSTLGNELHEIPVLVLKIMLSYYGWRVIYPGVNLPKKSLIKLINENKPDLVCLSLMFIDNSNKSAADIKEIHSVCKKANSKLVVGGNSLSKIKEKIKFVDFQSANLKQLLNYTKENFII